MLMMLQEAVEKTITTCRAVYLLTRGFKSSYCVLHKIQGRTIKSILQSRISAFFLYSGSLKKGYCKANARLIAIHNCIIVEKRIVTSLGIKANHLAGGRSDFYDSLN